MNFIVNKKICRNQIFLSFQVFQNWTFSVSAENLLNKFPNLTVMSQLIAAVSLSPRVTQGISLKAVQPCEGKFFWRIFGSQAKFVIFFSFYLINFLLFPLQYYHDLNLQTEYIKIGYYRRFGLF